MQQCQSFFGIRSKADISSRFAYTATLSEDTREKHKFTPVDVFVCLWWSSMKNKKYTITSGSQVNFDLSPSVLMTKTEIDDWGVYKNMNNLQKNRSHLKKININLK
jgi:hypothetical protein